MTNKQKYWKAGNIIQIRGNEHSDCIVFTKSDYFIVKDSSKAKKVGNSKDWLSITSFDDDLLSRHRDMPEFDIVNIYENIFNR